MGLFSKIRDILTYEDEVEEPIRKEVTTVSIPSPEPEEKYKSTCDFEIEEKEDYKAPEEIIIPAKPKVVEKPSFTIFTDSDFDLIDKKEVKEKKKEERKPYTPKEEVKKFRPTPIISPVYGLIKEEKEEKITNISSFSKPREEITLDNIRKKAYGVPLVEDDLENSLFTTKELSFETSNKNDIFDEVNNVLDERDSKEKIDYDSDEAINENDLFNLIDSMYERNND